MPRIFNLFLVAFAAAIVVSAQETPKAKTRYDHEKNKTTVSVGPVHLSGPKAKYHSLDFTLHSEYTGQTGTPPQRINFDLMSVVKARRLNTDLYVVFVVDGKPIHFSSNRSAVRNPVPGKPWIGERFVFLIPADEFKKLADADKLSIRMSDVEFQFDSVSRESLRVFFSAISKTGN